MGVIAALKRKNPIVFKNLPTSVRETLVWCEALDLNALHRFAEAIANFGELSRLLPVRDRLNHCFGADCWVFTHEDAASNEDSLCAELHAQGCIGWCCHAASSEVRYGELTFGRNILNDIERSAEVFGFGHQLVG